MQYKFPEKCKLCWTSIALQLHHRNFTKGLRYFTPKNSGHFTVSSNRKWQWLSQNWRLGGKAWWNYYGRRAAGLICKNFATLSRCLWLQVLIYKYIDVVNRQHPSCLSHGCTLSFFRVLHFLLCLVCNLNLQRFLFWFAGRSAFANSASCTGCPFSKHRATEGLCPW